MFVVPASLYGLIGKRYAPPAPTHVMDRWVRSRLHSTVRDVTEAFEDFELRKSFRQFVALRRRRRGR